SYHVASRAVFMVAATREGQRFVRVEFEKGLVETLCEAFQESIVIDSTTGLAPVFKVQFAIQLFDVLMRPLEEHFADVVHLFLIPDGPLWSISFETLLRDVESIDIECAITAGMEANAPTGMEPHFRRMRKALALSACDDPCAMISRADAWL